MTGPWQSRCGDDPATPAHTGYRWDCKGPQLTRGNPWPRQHRTAEVGWKAGPGLLPIGWRLCAESGPSSLPSHERVEQCLCLFQIGGIEPLGKQAVDGRQQFVRLGPAALFTPKPGEI